MPSSRIAAQNCRLEKGSTNRYFSNPYVDWASRDADRARMYAFLEHADVGRFYDLASRYRVRFILLTRDRSREWLRAAGLRPSDLPVVEPAALVGLRAFDLVFESPRFVILAVRPASEYADAGAGASSESRTGR